MLLLWLLQLAIAEFKHSLTATTSTNVCRKMMYGKFKSYITDPWNIFDQLMYIVLLVAVILRFALTTDSDFRAARYVYAINIIMFYLRILHLYYIHKRLGPEVIVIWKMVSDVGLVVIFIRPIAIAYSIGQIIKLICVCQCIGLWALSRSHFLIDFHQIWHKG